MDYFVLVHISDNEGACIESLPAGAPTQWRFDEGKPLAAGWPAGAALKFGSSNPKRRKLRDFMANILNLLIVSAKVRKVVESLGVANVEFLPAKMLDLKGKVVAPDYAILNVLGSEDAIDMARTECRMDALEPTQIDAIDALALDPGRIHADAKLFRASKMMTLFLIRDDVRQAFEDAGLTGYQVFPAEGWDGLPI